MNIILREATIIDPMSKNHREKKDICIENGVITNIASKIDTKEHFKEVKLNNLHISQGWLDPSVSFGEPGYEERETIKNGLKTAAMSGFTSVIVNTNTYPIADNKSHIEFLKAKALGAATSLHPNAALSSKSEGVHLAELFNMQKEGAVSFYDYKKPIYNPNLLKIALQYAQGFNGLVQSFPMEKSIAPKGIVNEEFNSTHLGLKGIPAVSEELQINRDLFLLEYTGGKLHIPTISTKKSVQLIKEAKEKGLAVSCSVAVNNLCLTDDLLKSFNANYKLMPPLRTQGDINALLKGLEEGVIDGITTDHNPINIEHKRVEFDHALYGSIGLESCFGALSNLMSTEKVVHSLTNLKKTFNISEFPINIGNKASISLFNPKPNWVFSEKHILSSSKNSALLGSAMKGQVYGIYNNNQLIIDESFI